MFALHNIDVTEVGNLWNRKNSMSFGRHIQMVAVCDVSLDDHRAGVPELCRSL